MNPYIIEIGKFAIRWYSVLILIGAAIAIMLTEKEGKKLGIKTDFIFNMAFWAIIFGFIGARIYYVAFNWSYYSAHFSDIFKIWEGGLAIHGGILFGLIWIIIYTKKYKLPTIDYFDVAAVVVPLGHAFGRVGCFFGGCCYGMPYSGKFAVVYTQTDGMTPLNQPLFPIQLLEAILLLLTFFCLFIVFMKKPNKRGMPTFLYTIVYSLMRFSLEFLRGDKERGIIGFLSTSQIISISILIASITIFIFIKKKRQKL